MLPKKRFSGKHSPETKCPIPGCNGWGNVDPKRFKHYSIFKCPIAVGTKHFSGRHSPGKCPTPGCDGQGNLDSRCFKHFSVASCPIAVGTKPHSSPPPKERKRQYPSSGETSSEEGGESQNPPPPKQLREETTSDTQHQTSLLLPTYVTQELPSTTCKKCSKLYTDPRILPCLHSFCKNCIESLVIQDGSKQAICCPSCRTTTPIPEKGGVEAIPQNVRLGYEAEVAMYEMKIKKDTPSECGECSRVPPQPIVAFCCTCRRFLCKPCHEHHCISRYLALNHKVLELEEARIRDISEELKQHIPLPALHCHKHTDAEIKFYCTSCRTLVCIQCTVIQHAGHKFEELNTFAQKQKENLNQSAQSIPNVITKLDEAIANGKVMTEKVGARKLLVNDMIQNTIQELHKALDEREQALLAQSSKITASKLTSLQLQMEEMASLRDKIISCCAAISETQTSHADAQSLSVVMVLQERLQELKKKFTAMTLQLQEDDMVSANLDTTSLVSEISMFGSIKKDQPRCYKSLSKPVMTISGITHPAM